MKARLQTQAKAATKPPFTHARTGLLQRKCACGGTPGPAGECEQCRKKRQSLHRKSLDSGRDTHHQSAIPSIVDEVLRSPGQPLEATTRAFMESRFGHDFSQVHVHTDAKASQSARAVNALAYTVGHNIVFDSEQYAPSSGEGRRLIAHELVHVVQQSAAPPNPPGVSITFPLAGESLEQEAEILGVQAAGGHSVTGMVRGRVAAVRTQFQVAPAARTSDKKEKKEEKDPVKMEWDAHPKIHAYFNGGFTDYQDLRPLLVSNTGTTNPAQWIEDNILTVTFFGHSTPTHTDTKAKVEAAEKTLKDAKVEPTINKFWSFVPRRIRGSTKLSKHALGKAVDINEDDNPRITKKAELAALALITGLDGALTPTDLKTKSDDFKADFNKVKYDEILQGEEKQKTEAKEKSAALRKAIREIELKKANANKKGKYKKLGKEEKEELRKMIEDLNNQKTDSKKEDANLQKTIKDLDKTIRNLKLSKSALLALTKTGFMNLDTQMVQAFIDAGFKWGGQFESSRDFMHFELE